MAKNNRYAPSVATERLDELAAALAAPAEGWPAASDAEVDALAARLAAADDGAALAALFARAAGKAQAKAVKGALFKLSQRGVAVPEVDKPTPIRIAPPPSAEKGMDVPLLLAPPERDATRRITLALEKPDGTGLRLVEAVFRANLGLYRLVAQDSARPVYQQWAAQLVASGERVRAGDLLPRKLWEIGRHAAAGALGPEVDRELLATLELPARRPAHPILEAPLKGARSLAFDAMVSQDERVRPFYHSGAVAKLRDQWYEAGGSAYLATTAESRAERASELRHWVVDLCKQWGWTGVIETVLDNAYYLAAIGDSDGALTLRDMVRDESERDVRVADFLAAYLGWVLEAG
jgi:hypothetical protein